MPGESISSAFNKDGFPKTVAPDGHMDSSAN